MTGEKILTKLISKRKHTYKRDRFDYFTTTQNDMKKIIIPVVPRNKNMHIGLLRQQV